MRTDQPGATLTATQPGESTAATTNRPRMWRKNQIPLWTLWSILHSGFCSAATSETIRHLYRTLAGSVSLQIVTVMQEIEQQEYNQLNQITANCTRCVVFSWIRVGLRSRRGIGRCLPSSWTWRGFTNVSWPAG
ncbi:MAG: hypothetical protein R2856_12315 [Caldilineaceae bacterium]